MSAICSTATFDADPAVFRRCVEALRISMSGSFEPMSAVSSSRVDPLPHQITAVYGELLPRLPLRFLLADDPGAGKTIMAGLLAKELILRGDVERMLIVAPGGLVDQWRDELHTRFGIDARLLLSGEEEPFRPGVVIARMDQLARGEHWREPLRAASWDLVVVDEAHRMAARWWGGELRTTARYRLGRLLGRRTRHLLLMTATPHAGSDDDFHSFLALLDEDRFAGRRRDSSPPDTTGLMRRMVKEDLRTFDGAPLFPERVAETVPYRLSPAEAALYEAVTEYVREEMNRAEAAADGRRRTVGFALTVLQRRLASSTAAITRSLIRRRERLAAMRADLAAGRRPGSPDREWDDPDDWAAAEVEEAEELVASGASAASTLAELDAELAALDGLVVLARRTLAAGEDRKWQEVRSLLLGGEGGAPSGGGAGGALSGQADAKLIVFTEHRDTLLYLAGAIRNVLGRDDAVVTIDGSTPRAERLRRTEAFTTEPARRVLVATDAAGEGLNLQAAHLMINYDLPWNPNRIEQRFGRIHRIGQQRVCRLWNLVAEDTREGQVFLRLLEKMEQQRRAYGGRLFDVLGEAFRERPLRELLIEAVRYGHESARRVEITAAVDAEVARGCDELIRERALAREALDPVELEALRRRMDDARARRVQPHFIEAWFREAFGAAGGRIVRRERGRFEITHVPSGVRRDVARPVSRAYRRVAFEPTLASPDSAREVDLLAPGHPLFDALLGTVAATGAIALRQGATLFDPNDAGAEPSLLVAVTTTIVDGAGTVVGRRFAFARVLGDGAVVDAGPAPHLDLVPLPEGRGIDVRGFGALVSDAAVSEAFMSDAAGGWIGGGSDGGVRRPAVAEELATALAAAERWARDVAAPAHVADVRARLVPQLARTRDLVRSRLIAQINLLDSQAAALRADPSGGDRRRRPADPARLAAQARTLEERLGRRMADLASAAQLAVDEPIVTAATRVIPAGALGGAPAAHARDTTVTDRRAVAAVLAAERRLGRSPEVMAHNNPGFDVRSTAPDGSPVYIEVKGRVEGGASVHVSATQVLFGKNTGAAHRLALVSVADAGPAHDDVRYLTDHFRGVDFSGLAPTGVELSWPATWAKGTSPH